MISPNQELGAAYDEVMRSKVFEPLGMTHTTVEFPTALSGNFASPHGNDVDSKTMPAPMDMNYSVAPIRPAGGMWTSARDLSKYIQMQLALGQLPDGRQMVSKESLLERRKGQVQTSEDAPTEWGSLSACSMVSRWWATGVACSDTRAT